MADRPSAGRVEHRRGGGARGGAPDGQAPEHELGRLGRWFRSRPGTPVGKPGRGEVPGNPGFPPTWRLSLSGSPRRHQRPRPALAYRLRWHRAPDLPRALLQRILAYRIQADAAGDLDPTTIKLLDRLGRGEIAEIPLPELRAVKPGTLLVREWEGTLQRVVVLESGFAWNGVTYESLSKVARAITGTNWNGPRFFGLRDRVRAS